MSSSMQRFAFVKMASFGLLLLTVLICAPDNAELAIAGSVSLIWPRFCQVLHGAQMLVTVMAQSHGHSVTCAD